MNNLEKLHNEPQISIIIPVYNAEKYLEEGIESIISQSIGFENIELIMVDDVSKDNSREIMEKYSNKYPNIHSIYLNENHGHPGFGRNTGINYSNADYVMFMDCDDKLDLDICKKLYETIIDENADISSCSLMFWAENNHHPFKYVVHKNLENASKIILENDDQFLFECGKTHGKLFKKEILIKNNVKFVEDIFFEDFLFLRTFELYSKKLVYLRDYCGYYWRVRDESTSHNLSLGYVKSTMSALDVMLDILKRENKEYLSPEIFRIVAFSIVQCYDLNCSNIELKHILIDLYDFERKINFSVNITDKSTMMINYLIINKHFNLALFAVKFMRTMKKSNLIKKIYRIIKLS